jgi:2'-hydroxyisoflavone reductase
MEILVIGGTVFLGRYIVAAARSAGHSVTVLHRGVDCSGAPGAEHLHADRDGDLGVLDGRHWDATIDVCAYYPRQVHHLAGALGDRGGHHVLISTVAGYAELPEPGLDEQAPLLAPLGLDGDAPEIDHATYGRLKVGCEQAAQHRYGGGLLVIRPTYIVGPHDPTGRFPFWVDRMARGGTVLSPGPAEGPMQCIDVRDLASFVVARVEHGDDETYHTVAPSPPYSMADLLAAVRDEVAPEGTVLEWASAAWLAERGVSPQELPLWTGSDDPVFALALDPDRALSAGLLPRPLAETTRDTLEWLRDPGTADGLHGSGLDPVREAELLNEWARR